MTNNPLTWTVICALCAWGCTSGVGPRDVGPTDPTTDPATDPSTDPATDPTDPTPDPTPASCDTGTTHTFVIDVMDLASPDPAGDPSIVPGFDLDALVSDGTDAASCHQTDYVSPDGVPGIDNQLAPAITDVPDLDVSGELARSIQRGDLILLVRVSGVDDLVNDDCVDVDVLFGLLPEEMTAPEMATGDRFVPGQTFDVSERTLQPDGRPRFGFRAARIVGGRLEAESGAAVPFQIPAPDGELVELTLYSPKISAEVDEGGIARGVLGGRLDVGDTIVSLSAFASPVLVDALVTGLADLDPDDRGVCQSVSVAAVYQGVPAEEGLTR